MKAIKSPRGLRLLVLVPVLAAIGASAEAPPYYQQILARLKIDDSVIPWQPDGVADTELMYNREAPIPPQCYTDTDGIHNPCYVCHQDRIPGRENAMNDFSLQQEYAFSDMGLTNHWINLFEDRSDKVAEISDDEIQAYIDQDNYSELPVRLRRAGFQGWIPDLKNLQYGAKAFDKEGFARDGSWWVAFKYKPLPSTFWPTQGSTDDVMIRLPSAFYHDAGGLPSRDVYKANLALLEASIKGVDHIGSLPIDETAVGEDLDGDGQLLVVSEVLAQRANYVGSAANIERIPHVYPKDTEFLHTVRYVGVDDKGQVYAPRRMKEVRYMKRRLQSRHYQLEHYYEEENLEKSQGALPTYINLGHQGLSTDFGWNITGFLEAADGKLRWNTYEENVFCMGCHTSIGSTVDKTFSFPRKADGAEGWGYISLRGMPDAPSQGESRGEVGTYLERVGGGTEFRGNPELEARYYHPDGSVNTVALAKARDFAKVATPSRERALQLNKAYRVIVKEQDFIFGRDATVTPPSRVLAEVDRQSSPTLPEDRRHVWDIVLDWEAAKNAGCNYMGDVDFRPLTYVYMAVADPKVPPLCATGAIQLGGTMRVKLPAEYTPEAGRYIELIRAGTALNGTFRAIRLPTAAGGTFKVEQSSKSLGVRFVAE